MNPPGWISFRPAKWISFRAALAAQARAISECREDLRSARTSLTNYEGQSGDVLGLVRGRAKDLLDKGDLQGAKALLETWAPRYPTSDLRDDLARVGQDLEAEQLCKTPIRVDFTELELEPSKYDGRCISTRARYFFGGGDSHTLNSSSAGEDLRLMDMEKVDLKVRKRLVGLSGALTTVGVEGVLRRPPDSSGLGKLHVRQLRF